MSFRTGPIKADVMHSRRLGIVLFILWLCLVLLLVRHHAFWRDEVRILSVAKEGSLISMLKSLRGDGHPALWYLLIRWAYFLIGSPAVLWIVSVCVAAAAALLLVLRSPFGWPLIALFLFGRIALFEYSVMARNYGIGMLLMFLFAACYWRHRDHGIVLGGLLFLLANTHALSALLVGAFLLFWLIDVLSQQGIRWTPALKSLLVNATIAAVGLAVSFATIYPPAADAVPIGSQIKIGLTPILGAILEPASTLGALAIKQQWEQIGLGSLGSIVMSLIIFGSLFGLIRSTGAFIAALTALVSFLLFFNFIFAGQYRHQALWLVFLISMYWIVLDKAGPKTRDSAPNKLIAWTTAVGSALMVLLVAAQVREGFRATEDVVLNRAPQSRSRDFGALIKHRPDLKDAIIMADPDLLLEALPYYIDNATYLMREERFGNVVTFTKNARLDLELDDILAVANQLHMEFRKPVVILLAHRLGPDQPAATYREGYNWRLITNPEQVRRFLASTRLLVRFAPAKSDESYDVYLLDRP